MNRNSKGTCPFGRVGDSVPQKGRMTKRPENLIYALDEKPPFKQLAVLGLQQVCIVSIYLVLVVVVVKEAGGSQEVLQNAVGMAMIALAIGSFLQALPRGPLGSGFLAPPVVSAIYLQPSLLAVGAGGLPLVFGMTMLAGVFEIVVSRLYSYLRQLFPPVVSGLIVIAVGLELGLLGVGQLLDVKGDIHTENFLKHVVAGAFTLVMMISMTIWGNGIVRLLSAIFGILIGWVLAVFLGLIPESSWEGIQNADLLRFPNPSYISYDFDTKLIIPFFIAGLAAALRTIGVITTCQKINDAEWKRPETKSIKKGVLSDGVACMASGLLGVQGMSTSPSAVGVSQFTLATSRYIAFSVSAWFLLFSCFPKLTAVFIAIPGAVVGATLIYTGSMMLVSGIQIISSHPLDVRKTFIIGVSIFLGLGHQVYPVYFEKLPGFIRLFAETTLSITTISALFLNAVFRIKSRQSTIVLIETAQVDMDQIDQIVRQNVKKWGGTISDAENTSMFIKTICSLLVEGHYADGEIKAKISFDETQLILDVYYDGKLLHIPLSRATAEEEMIDEIPMTKGLAGFLTGIYPDHISCSAKNSACHIQLIFEL